MNAVRWWQRAAGLLMVLFLLTVGWKMRAFIWTAVQNAVVRSWYPVWGTNLRDIPDSEEGKRHSRLAGWKKQTQGEADPSYYKYLEEQEVRQEYMDFLAQFSGSRLVDGTLLGKWNGLVHESGRQGGGETDEERLYSVGKNGEKTERANPAALVDSPRLRKKLEDYDYLIQHFFTIHPTASIDRSLMNAETFLSMDLTIRKDEADGPQILIYHTHSQENYRDYAGSDGKGAVVSLGEELAKRLRAKGYQVWHDTTAYEVGASRPEPCLYICLRGCHEPFAEIPVDSGDFRCAPGRCQRADASSHADRRETNGTDHVFQRYQRDAGRTDRVSGKSLPEGKSGVQFSDEVECRSDISWVYADDLFKGASLQSTSTPALGVD